MNNGGKSKRIADSTGGVLLCYSFLLHCLENGTIMWGGEELDNFEVVGGLYAKRRYC